MKQTAGFEEVDEVADVPASPLLVREQANRYGSVPGLDDEELSDPEELERQAFAEQWGPILALPVHRRQREIQPTVDENGRPDWGAFGTMDFQRTRSSVDKVRYKAQKLKEQLKDVLIMFSIVKERLPGRAKYVVLKCLRMGIIDQEHIESPDMLALAKLHMRARNLQEQVADLEEASLKRRRQKAEAWLAATP